MSPDQPGVPASSSASADASPTPLGPTFEPTDTPLPDDVRDRRQVGYVAAAVVVLLGLLALAVVAYLATTPPVDLARPVPPAFNTDADEPVAAEDAEWPRLRPGDQGRPVRAAQILLRGQGQQLEVTGRYGAATTTAVARFARENDLEVRSVDERTWGSLVSRVGPGDSGRSVRALQVLLRGSGFPDVAVDGDFSPATRGTLRLFQVQSGLPGSGAADRATWRALAANAEPLRSPTATRERPQRRGR